MTHSASSYHDQIFGVLGEDASVVIDEDAPPGDVDGDVAPPQEPVVFEQTNGDGPANDVVLE